jgi:F-type H+-transporting ATPase subunit gamma
METLEALKRRIDGVRDLRSVVRTMKVLAAVSIRQYEKAVESLATYNRTVEMGFQVLFRNPPGELAARRAGPSRQLGAIVFGSDQGMAGQFNEQIATFALNHMEAQGITAQDRRILVLGLRVTARLEDAGQPVEATGTVPGSVASITPAVQDILMQVDDWHSRRAIDRVFLYYNTPVGTTAYRPRELPLLPVDLDSLRGLRADPWPSRSLPTFSMEWNELFSALIRQYLFVSLSRALSESLASENASRLAAMQAAEKNIQEHLEELNNLFHQRRQTAITEELLDIVSGFEVLTGQDTG